MNTLQDKDDSQAGFTLMWERTERTPVAPDIWAVRFGTNQGNLAGYYHEVPGDLEVFGGVVWVGGAEGGVEGPASGLYNELCKRLQRQGVAGLRLDYRHPNYLDDCVLDTLLGVAFLQEEGAPRTAVVGHSFGGAVVINAATLTRKIDAVVALSSQTYGTELVGRISPRPILIVHGTDDRVLPDTCSRMIYKEALEPKELKLLSGAGHGLDSARGDLADLLASWIPEKLGAKPVRRVVPFSTT